MVGSLVILFFSLLIILFEVYINKAQPLAVPLKNDLILKKLILILRVQ